MQKSLIIVLFLFQGYPITSGSVNWGFFAHKRINRLAVFTLPPEMIGFYKYHIQYITEKAVNPDMRRYLIADEAPRHYIDLDVYGENPLDSLPQYWDEAVAKYSEDTLMAYGIAPWHIFKIKRFLTAAFKRGDMAQILRLSADIGHYIADANVPLHTTENYNGQLTDQVGIHGFWESRLPELFSDEYDLFTGQASYLYRPQLTAWEAISQAHQALDSVLLIEKILTSRFDPSKKYSFEERGATTVRVYAYDFSAAYHRKLDGMVARRMRAAIKMVGDFWYSSWVDGGQPDLNLLTGEQPPADTISVDSNRIHRLRNHESGVSNE